MRTGEMVANERLNLLVVAILAVGQTRWRWLELCRDSKSDRL
ncbi:hypothetical protein [Leptolyngbya sp. FACHB-321]|nr:hypothetical protein [Leptolyngbya sp. FACHB-321]